MHEVSSLCIWELSQLRQIKATVAFVKFSKLQSLCHVSLQILFALCDVYEEKKIFFVLEILYEDTRWWCERCEQFYFISLSTLGLSRASIQSL